MTPSEVREQRQRVLILRTGALGDVLHALPAVQALRLARPEWEIGWAIEPHLAALLERSAAEPGSEGEEAGRGPHRPLVDRVHRAPIRNWKRRLISVATLREVLHLRSDLRGDLQGGERYDVCVDVQGLIRSAVIGRMAGAGKLTGMAEPREAPAAWVYDQRVRTQAAHVVERGCEIVGAATGTDLQPQLADLPTDPAAECRVEAFLSGLGAHRGLVLMAPTAGWGAKVWPAARYGEVAAALGRAGYGSLVNAASAEDATGRAVVEASGGCAVLAVGGVADLIALTRRVDLLIAGDTGPLHLAAALGVPVVGLYGPTDPERNGPYGTRAAVLRHPSSVQDHRRWHVTERGLMQIGADEVVGAALGMLEGSGDAEQGSAAARS